MNRISVSTLLTTITLVATPPAMALDSDSDQPIHIEADSVSIDDQKQISRYRGQVKLSQGSVRATGDEIMLYSSDDGADRLIMVGNPATFRQRPEGKENDAHGNAARIEHDSDTELTVFEGEARFWLDQEEFAGERIEYDARNDRVRAQGSSDGTGRVRIVIQPKNKNDDEKENR